MRDRVRVAEVDLLLSRPGLALRALDGDPRRLHPVADLAHERLVVGRGEDRVVEDVRHRRRQVAVVLGVRLGVGLLQQIELELAPEHRLEPGGSRSLNLCFQHLARRGDDRRAVLPVDVAEHHRRPRQPRHAAQRREIRSQVEVAVPRVPTGHCIPGLRVHLHVERQQVVAALESVLDRLGEEIVGLLALSHQTALHVGERADDRVDRSRLDLGSELFHRQHAVPP